ncbi:MAG: hypothetical protein Q9226_004429 [Calogaya cf. arnoldii]
MYNNILALLLLSGPFLTQASPVSSVEAIDDHPANLSSRLIEPALGTLTARANDDANCDNRQACLDTGEKNWNALVAKLKDDSATDVTQYDDTLKQDYFPTITRDATPDGIAFKDLFQKDLKLDFNGHFAEHAYASKQDGIQAYVNMYNTNQGTLVNVYNFKERDSKQTLPFSEVVFQCYKNECDEIEELKKFKFAGVANIANTEYVKLIDEIHDGLGFPKTGPKAGVWRHWTYEKNQKEFLAFLGTPKLGYILRMLADHSVAFDKRIPTDLWTNKLSNVAYVVIDKYRG